MSYHVDTIETDFKRYSCAKAFVHSRSDYYILLLEQLSQPTCSWYSRSLSTSSDYSGHSDA